MPAPSLDVAGLYAALDEKRKSEDISWRQLARAAGISPSTLTRMAQGRRPDVDSFGALTRWLGQPADVFLARRSCAPPEPEPFAVISTLLRARRDLSTESAEALEDIIRVAYERLRERDIPNETSSRVQGRSRTNRT